jgi:hypothetical protein
MNGKKDDHPNLDTLVDLAEGVLTDVQAARVSQHLQQCVPCRLEARRLARFATIDTDEELLAEADWSRARFALGKAYREKIRPAISTAPEQTIENPEDRARGSRRHSILPRGWWVAPIAAAAVLVLVFLGQDRGLGPGSPDVGQEPFRGGQQLAQSITPVEPVGEVSACPQVFTWQTSEAFGTYTLEIFTPDLELVFRQENIATSSFTLTESLREKLAPGQIYLWSIKGHRGMQAAAVSANGWFRFQTRG